MIDPKRRTRSLVFLFAFIMAFSALATMAPMTEAADNEAPDWSVGDGVALHMSMDFLSIYNAYEDNFTDGIEEFLMEEFEYNVTLNDISVTMANINSVLMVEVTSVTATTYTVVQTAALEMKFAISVNWDLFSPAAGSHANETAAWETADNRTMTASFNIATGFVETVTMVLEKDSMALKSVSMSLRPVNTMAISMSNIPYTEGMADDLFGEDEEEVSGSFTDAEEEGPFNISYGNFNLNFMEDVKFTASAAFAPSFNLFNLPHSDADNWSTNTENITLTAGFTGIIDLSVSGNYPLVPIFNENMSRMFENIPENITGVTGFPINLASISIPADEIDEDFPANITNGAFPEQVIAIPQFEVEPEGNVSDNMTGFFEDNFTTYYVWSDDLEDFMDNLISPPAPSSSVSLTVGPIGFPYSATILDLNAWSDILDEKTEGMVASMNSTVSSLLNISELNITGAMTFESISTASANDIVNSITQAMDPAGEDGFDIVGFFTDSPYYGIIALVAIIAVVAILTRRG